MLDKFLKERPIAGFCQRVPEFDGGPQASRASREPRMTFPDQDACPLEEVLNVFGGYTDQGSFLRVTIPSRDDEVKKIA